MEIKPKLCNLQEAFPSFDTRKLFLVETSNQLGFVYLINEMASVVSQGFFSAIISLDGMGDIEIVQKIMAYVLNKDFRDVSIIDDFKNSKEIFETNSLFTNAIILRNEQDKSLNNLKSSLKLFCRKTPLKVVFINRIDLLMSEGNLNYSLHQLRNFAKEEDICIIGTGLPNAFHGLDLEGIHNKYWISMLDENRKFGRMIVYCENLALQNWSDFNFDLQSLQINEIS